MAESKSHKPASQLDTMIATGIFPHSSINDPFSMGKKKEIAPIERRRRKSARKLLNE